MVRRSDAGRPGAPSSVHPTITAPPRSIQVPRRSALTLVALGVLLLMGAVLTAAPSEVDAAAPTWRVSEPVVMSGESLGHFEGLAVEAIGVWSVVDGSWQRVPSQVDQRDDNDAYTPDEGNNVLDANDELVFMADGLGDARQEGSWPPGVNQVLSPAEITATDPLHEGYVGYAYVFESPSATFTPQVTFDDPSTEIRTASYTLGFATEDDGFFGIKRLSLMGESTDRVDRSKMRITIPNIGELNEETLGQFGGLPPVDPVIEGPVRLVMDAAGASLAYGARATLFNFELGGQIPPIPGLEVRFSLDFAPNAAGATYRAENTPRGVTIDGQPDRILPLPYPMWREMTFSEGRLAILATGEPPPLLVRTYYKDDSTVDDTDTGDKMSYGDNGVIASTLQGLADVGFLGQMVALSPDNPTGADDLADQLAKPLEITVQVEAAGSTLYIPLTVKHF